MSTISVGRPECLSLSLSPATPWGGVQKEKILKLSTFFTDYLEWFLFALIVTIVKISNTRRRWTRNTFWNLSL